MFFEILKWQYSQFMANTIPKFWSCITNWSLGLFCLKRKTTKLIFQYEFRSTEILRCT